MSIKRVHPLLIRIIFTSHRRLLLRKAQALRNLRPIEEVEKWNPPKSRNSSGSLPRSRLPSNSGLIDTNIDMTRRASLAKPRRASSGLDPDAGKNDFGELKLFILPSIPFPISYETNRHGF